MLSRQHVLRDRHRREGVGLLEHHPYTQPRFGHPNALTINVLAVQEDLTGEASTGHELVHPVECAQVCRFPAPGWPNEGGDLAGAHYK